MQKLTEEQFKQKYGQATIDSFNQPQQDRQTTASERVFNTINTAGQNVQQAISGEGEYAGQSSVRRGTQAAAEMFNAIPKVVVDLMPQPVRTGIEKVGNVINKGFNAVTNKISDTKLFKELGELEAQGFITRENAPELYRVKEALGTIAPLGEISGDILAAKGTVDTVNKGGQIINKGTQSVSNTVKSGVERVKPKPITPEIRLQKAIEDATPNYETMTSSQKQKVLGQVSEGGILKGRQIKPNAFQQEAGAEVAKIPEYNPDATKLEKYQLVKSEVSKKGEELKNSLKNENIIVPKKEVTARVKQALGEVPKDSLILQKSDPSIKNYLRVYNNAINKVDGNLDGVLELRKRLDSAYENARGGQAFGSEKIAALDEVHTAVRNKLTEYLIEKAKNTDVKASLRSQWNLYRALDELQIAAAKESGSKFGRLKQKFPVTNRVVQTGIRTAGLGAGLNIIQ